ncbi:sigma-70 family RNA polymerase sigma factor [Acetonema longum]|uniref:RNA polymerase sigma-70 region 4 domain-containing protein n=1 Tax=Acetonema longum DSM 6540 TaxID=1009370 RepID=F7NE98_9FIRM|nr:sigma-70 family RNA polymerase sigma factor [Acetonema longum]EGO65610.1 hypothetical protein ALO_01804 [Acetonema longum DSM 6540]
MSYDKTQKMLSELKEYINHPAKLQRKMGFYENREDYLTWRHNAPLEDRYRDRNIEYILQQHSATPEEILLEKERQQEIIDLLLYIRAVIGAKEFQMLWLYVVDGLTQQQIAAKFHTHQQKISRILKKILEKVQKKCVKTPEICAVIWGEQSFCSPISPEAGHPKRKIDYPYEFLQAVNAGGHWRSGKYISRKVCRVPEYLAESFGDSQTKCPLCMEDNGDYSCTRQE